MKTRLLLATLLMLTGGPAYAEWVPLDRTDGATFYVDHGTIRHNEGVTTSWELVDFETVQTLEGFSYLSLTAQRELDCVQERTRVLSMREFSDNIGIGNVVYSTSDEDAGSHVTPGSVDETLWKLACDRQ